MSLTSNLEVVGLECFRDRGFDGRLGAWAAAMEEPDQRHTEEHEERHQAEVIGIGEQGRLLLHAAVKSAESLRARRSSGWLRQCGTSPAIPAEPELCRNLWR